MEDEREQSRQMWNRIVAYIFSVIIALSITSTVIAIIWALAVSNTKNQIETERYAAHYAESASQKIQDTCSFTDLSRQRQCIEEIVKATHEQQRNEADLNAQREMADWAYAMTIVAIFSFLLTIAGIYFVRENLVEMQRQRTVSQAALNAANRSAASAFSANAISEAALEVNQINAQRQLRAYICVDTAQIDFTNPEKPVAEVWFKNYGQTPAKNVRIWIHTWLEENPLGVSLPIPPSDFLMSSKPLGPGARTFHKHGHGGTIVSIDQDRIMKSEMAFYVYAVVSYTDIFWNPQTTNYRLFFHGLKCDGKAVPMMAHYQGNDIT